MLRIVLRRAAEPTVHALCLHHGACRFVNIEAPLADGPADFARLCGFLKKLKIACVAVQSH